MINLITSFFRPENTERLNELMTCLKNNIDSKYIKKIYLFMESKDDIEFLKQEIKITRNKIQLILWNKQPFYSDYLNLANQLKGEICMISNADIWLKKCDIDLINLVNQGYPQGKNIGYALTRHEHDMSSRLIDIFAKNHMSYDSFILKSPIYIDLKLISHQQNRMGSENVFKRELEETDIIFYNPCKDIVIVHEHKSELRNYGGEDMLSSRNIYPIGKTKQGGVLYGHKWIYNKDLKYSPPIPKQELLRIVKPSRQSGRSFKSASSLFGRH